MTGAAPGPDTTLLVIAKQPVPGRVKTRLVPPYTYEQAAVLEITRWCGRPDDADEELLAHCIGPVLDVGCGPGRLTVALTERGIPALGVDISRAVIARARQAGAPALHRSVFEPLPGEGRWATVLLADGNNGRRGPLFPWARLGNTALLRAVADAGWYVTKQWRYADRVFACAVARRNICQDSAAGLPDGQRYGGREGDRGADHGRP